MADPLRHRQTKGAATDMVDLTPPRHIPTLLKRGQPRPGKRITAMVQIEPSRVPRPNGGYPIR